MKSKWGKIAAIIIAAVAIADLATGQSDQPLLPASIGNALTQQIDFILLAVAAFIFFVF